MENTRKLGFYRIAKLVVSLDVTSKGCGQLSRGIGNELRNSTGDFSAGEPGRMRKLTASVHLSKSRKPDLF
jgi:hypothetical protein